MIVETKARKYDPETGEDIGPAMTFEVCGTCLHWVKRNSAILLRKCQCCSDGHQ